MVNKCEHLTQFQLPIVYIQGGNCLTQSSLCLSCGVEVITIYPFGEYQLVCPFRHKSSYIAQLDKEFGESYVCQKCGEPIYDLVPLVDVDSPIVIINYIQGELENANHHSEIHLVSKLFDALEGDKLKIAWTLYNVFLG